MRVRERITANTEEEKNPTPGLFIRKQIMFFLSLFLLTVSRGRALSVDVSEFKLFLKASTCAQTDVRPYSRRQFR